MGNTSSSSSRSRRSRSPETAAERAKKVVGDIHEELRKSVKKLDDDHPAAQLIDSVCGGYFDDDKYRQSRSASFYSEEISEDDSRTVSEDDATYDDRGRGKKDATSVESSSYISQSDYDSEPRNRRRKGGTSSNSFDTEDDSKQVVDEGPPLLSKPLASSFAKRCYFTKAGIGKTTQHYEGLTLTGNIVLMLAAAMKLKGCPTICDEDLRRVEQTYPNQFSRLPDELLLSSGWRRISKYCHFSNKPIPDGVPFFHSKQRLHSSGGYYFLLAAAVGMVRPIDVEPLTRDTLVLLETDFPQQCDATPDVLIREPEQWTLVDKFCFFSGGPINTDEDVYYQADFDGNPIFMLAFLSPSLTPEELYKLSETGEPGLKSVAAVEEVESVYDLTERDFDDLKLYHLGPCRALPQYILQPQAWTKVLPPHFLAARQTAMLRAQDYENRHGVAPTPAASPPRPQSQDSMIPPQGSDFAPDTEYFEQQYPEQHYPEQHYPDQQVPTEEELAPSPQPQNPHHDYEPQHSYDQNHVLDSPATQQELQREVEEEGAFMDNSAPIDEAIASRAGRSSFPLSPPGKHSEPETPKMDPPEDEPPSLSKREATADPAVEYEGEPSSSHFFDENQEESESPMPQRGAYTSGAFEENQLVTSYYDNAPDPVDPIASPDDEQRVVPFDGDYYSSPEKSTRNGEEYYPDEGADYYVADQPYYGSPGTPDDGEYYQSDYRYRNDHDHYNGDSNYLSPDDKHPHYGPSGGMMTRSPPDDPFEQGDGMYSTDGEGFSPGHDAYSPGEEYPIDEEKKVGSDEPGDHDVDYASSVDYDKVSPHSAVNNDDGFTPVKRRVFPSKSQTTAPSSRSVSSRSIDNQSLSQSSAMRGAQELLKKNRRRRMEMAIRSRNREETRQQYDEPNDNPASPTSPKDDESQGTWESGSEMTASVISGSSAWTESSNPTDRSSRRALILQMAKARMKSNKEQSRSPDDKIGATIEEERSVASNEGGRHGQEANAADIDFSADLD